MSSSVSSQSASATIGSAPAGCSTTRPETFALSVRNQTASNAKRSLNLPLIDLVLDPLALHTHERRDDNTLAITLTGGTMVDSQGRIGYVTTNGQFQFQSPPLPNQLYTSPFSVCANSSLALGSTAVWYQCLSGDFYNLYYFSQGAECFPIEIDQVLLNSTSTSTISASSASTTLPGVTSTTAGTGSSSPAPSPAAGSKSHAGAIAGGVVGGLAGLALLGGAVAFFVLRQKKKKKEQLRVPEMHGDSSQFHELGTNKPAVEVHNAHISELYGSNVSELHGHDVR